MYRASLHLGDGVSSLSLPEVLLDPLLEAQRPSAEGNVTNVAFGSECGESGTDY